MGNEATKIRQFAARGDGETPVTSIIQEAIDTCPVGGTVCIPPGRWLTGTLVLRSNITLHLDAGAVLLGSPEIADYPESFPSGVTTMRPFGRRLILAQNCRNVAITGQGCIDGQGGCWGQVEGGAENHPVNLQFIKCTGITVRDVHLRQSGSWMQQYLQCRDVHISGIRVYNHGNKTNDGLDIDGCTDVRISDCDIDSHDDALVFKSTGPLPCRDILVTNCRLRSHCYGIKFGSESIGGFERISISNCIVTASGAPSTHPRFPDILPVVTGLAICTVDGGPLRDISISQLVVDTCFSPLLIRLGARHRTVRPDDPPPDPGTLEDILIRDLRVRNCGPFGGIVAGYPGHPVRNIRIDGMDLRHTGGVMKDQIQEVIADRDQAYPDIKLFGSTLDGKHVPAYGLYIRHAENLVLSNYRFATESADAREAVVCEHTFGCKLG
jgi:polygalacturonase